MSNDLGTSEVQVLTDNIRKNTLFHINCAYEKARATSETFRYQGYLISWTNFVYEYNEPLLFKETVVLFDLLLVCIIRQRTELNFFSIQQPTPSNSRFNLNLLMTNVGTHFQPDVAFEETLRITELASWFVRKSDFFKYNYSCDITESV
jgi:hypothetical protein